MLDFPWRPFVAWGTPLLLAVFFLVLGVEAPLIDLIIRGFCVGLVASSSRRLLRSVPVVPQPVEQEPQPKDQLSPVYYALSTLDLHLSLQRFVDEFTRIVPCSGALLILLTPTQEKPEYIIAKGQTPSPSNVDLATLLPEDLFLEVLEQKTVVLNTRKELHNRLNNFGAGVFARQSLFVGSMRRQQHLAFLLMVDRADLRGFLPQDVQLFTTITEAVLTAIENARRFADLQATEKKHRDILHGLIHAQEQESKLVAEEWHERISGKLFGVLQGLRSFQNLIAQRTPENGERFQQLTAEIDGVAALVRGLANELHPSVLDDFGVAAAIREYVADVTAGILDEQEPLQVTVQAEDVDQQLPSEAQLTLFRITQEALRNIRKHAGARNVQIAFVQEHAGVSLMIKDDGKGFNPEQSQPGHFGLQYMRERAEACGGTFRVISARGQGTEVCVKFPILSALQTPLPLITSS
ncbi:MAG: sensor histidine kinase [Deltaproteobacteria bacterium]|nr:sensor histidine kinase [Deltaproteobacteria bacterium]